MTDDEYQKIKAAEKERLRAKKKLRELKGATSRRKTIRSALQRVKKGAESLLQHSTDLIDDLTRETARQEARLEVALDASDAPSDAEAEDRSLDEQDREARADALVQQLKMTAVTQTGDRTDADEAAADDADADDDALPEKTIGRMRKRP